MDWREKYKDLIAYNARLNHLEIPLIEGIIQVESGGDPDAYRYEPQWRYFVDFLTGRPHRGSIVELPKPKHVTRHSEVIAQKISYGLMQIMGSVAREAGFHGKYLSALYRPEVNLKFGTIFLRRCFTERGGNTVQALIRWNGSSSYPPKVFRAMEEMGHTRPRV